MQNSLLRFSFIEILGFEFVSNLGFMILGSWLHVLLIWLLSTRGRWENLQNIALFQTGLLKIA
jgi:hypothetical protein